jgi:hypothetical protein
VYSYSSNPKNMHLKYKTIKYAKLCSIKKVLFDSVEREPNVDPDSH